MLYVSMGNAGRFLGFVLVPTVSVVLVWTGLAKRAKRLGYVSIRAYLEAAPRTDREKRDAADLALRGLVWCLLGLVVAPCVLVGLVPLFYGGRKLMFTSMGLGLVDDADESPA
jgi:hypothetical protein